MDNDDEYSLPELGEDGLERFVLFLLVSDALDQNAQWLEFERQLIYENRFSSDHPIVMEIRRQQKHASITIPAGSVFFRARTFDRSSYADFLRYCFQNGGMDQKRFEELVASCRRPELLFSTLLRSYSGTETPVSATLLKMQQSWKKNVRFKGYNASESAPPPPDKVGPARANPDHIRYLYLSEDDVTPVYEIHPIIGQTVSIAQFRLNRELTVYDLTQDIDENKTEHAPPSLFNSIGRMFSKPHNGNPTKYIATQFVAEEIKRLGFDGLRYASSVHQGGINLVLFDPDSCEAVSSDLVEVRGINVDMERPLIYRLGEGNDLPQQS